MSEYDWQDIPTSDRPKGHSSTEALEIGKLRAELSVMKSAGICEVAAVNPSIMEYMRHWEGRTEDAEAEAKALRERVAELEAVLEPLLLRLCEWAADNLTDESARDWFGYVEPPLERARAALQTGLQCDEGTMGDNGS
jgi:hypothetical protein